MTICTEDCRRHSAPARDAITGYSLNHTRRLLKTSSARKWHGCSEPCRGMMSCSALAVRSLLRRDRCRRRSVEPRRRRRPCCLWLRDHWGGGSSCWECCARLSRCCSCRHCGKRQSCITGHCGREHQASRGGRGGGTSGCCSGNWSTVCFKPARLIIEWRGGLSGWSTAFGRGTGTKPNNRAGTRGGSAWRCSH